jgi:hypothetical protein
VTLALQQFGGKEDWVSKTLLKHFMASIIQVGKELELFCDIAAGWRCAKRISANDKKQFHVKVPLQFFAAVVG